MPSSVAARDAFPIAIRSEMKTISVLGTPLLLTNYTDLGKACCHWTESLHPVALDFANTQIVTMRRHEPEFRTLTSAYDYFPPDGMPLVWCLNRAGAGLEDRVYGPTFMRLFMKDLPAGYSHYVLGGTKECGTRLQEALRMLNPSLKFVGAFHGVCQPDGRLEPQSEKQVLEEINQLSPDFIWVGFGTPKQQAWVKHYKAQIKRGVILTVGFAFDVNAGMKPDAPAWMQKFGMTWVFRLATEPRRLGSRYLRYNFLFLWYLLRDGLNGGALGGKGS